MKKLITIKSIKGRLWSYNYFHYHIYPRLHHPLYPPLAKNTPFSIALSCHQRRLFPWSFVENHGRGANFTRGIKYFWDNCCCLINKLISIPYILLHLKHFHIFYEMFFSKVKLSDWLKFSYKIPFNKLSLLLISHACQTL